MSDLDAIVIGAGHNGLTCAAYLGMAGLRVRVVERRGVVGGAAVTEEFHPGFRNSTAAYAVSLLQPKIIRDLKLHEHGLRIVERRAQNFLPLPDGRYLLTGEGRSASEIAKFSAKDAARYGAYQAEIGRVADVLRSLVLAAPPNLALRNFGDSARQLGCDMSVLAIALCVLLERMHEAAALAVAALVLEVLAESVLLNVGRLMLDVRRVDELAPTAPVTNVVEEVAANILISFALLMLLVFDFRHDS